MSREMVNSGIPWIGDIPTSWSIMPHKRVMHKVKEIQEHYSGEKILSLTMRGVIVRDLDAGGKMPTTFDGYQKVYPNNLLQCLFDIDVTPRCVGLIKDEGLTSPAYSQFEMYYNGYAPYYDYLLRYMDDRKTLLHLSKNLRSSLTETDFGAVPTCVPPVAEQQKIASFLDSKCSEIDDMIALQEKIVEELKAYKQSVITEAVTQGLDPNVQMKDSGIEWIGEIPEHWIVKELKFSLDGLCDGTHGTFERVDNGELLLSAKNIGDRGIVFGDNESQISNEDYLKIISNGYPRNGDVLLCCVGSIGKCCIFNEDKPIAFQRSVAFLRHNKTMTSEYLMYLLKSNIMQAQYEMYARKSAQSGIYMGVIKDFVIVVSPCIDEQEAIAGYLDNKCGEIDELIAIKQSKIDSLKEYKKSIIYEYVTGKKEVIE